MKILSIETSCDETAVAVVECEDTADGTHFTVLGNGLVSQIDLHQAYGGVFPTLAKREHAKNLVPVLTSALEESGLLRAEHAELEEDIETSLKDLLVREPELCDALTLFLQEHGRPSLDAIAVTSGPGLPPALWVGVNFARALSRAWDIPLIPVNHMEGHIFSSLVHVENEGSYTLSHTELPVLALLISGGHTELLVMKEWLVYELIGQTRDDAVGEAFDKVARMMHLPYPGGPEISKLAERDREDERTNPFDLPRPMIDSPDYDFSFSGLKTAVMYLLKEKEELTDVEREQLARAFEDSVAEVLWKKTAKALEDTGARTLVIGGGVSANVHLKRVFTERMAREFPDVAFTLPPLYMTTDNAVMIALAGYARKKEPRKSDEVRADGNLSLAQRG